MTTAGRKKGELFFKLYQSTSIYNHTKQNTPENVKTAEIRLFWLICGLLDDLDVITVKEIVILNKEINGYSDSSTYSAITQLKSAQLIHTNKVSNEYWARSYISISDSGNLLKAMIREQLNFNPHAILKKHEKERAEKRKKQYQKRAKTRIETNKRLKAQGKPINQHPPKPTF